MLPRHDLPQVRRRPIDKAVMMTLDTPSEIATPQPAPGAASGLWSLWQSMLMRWGPGAALAIVTGTCIV
jgi:hypothetical protein